MSEAVTRFAQLLQLFEEIMARAERDDLEECAREIYIGHQSRLP